MAVTALQLHGMLDKKLRLDQNMAHELRTGFRLGEFDVFPLRNKIVGPNGPVHIQPKAMDVLCCLANNKGDVVARESLLDEVWQRTVVTDEVLTRCISELRSALGDNANKPFYIQTVPKRGYRLLASVNDPEQKTQIADSHSSSFWEELKRRSVFRVGVAYAAIAWLVIEVVETIFPRLGLPDWLISFIVIGAVIGFPVACALAWTFEITASGIERDRPGIERDTNPNQPLRRLDMLTIVAVLLAIGVVAFQFSKPSIVPVTNSPANLGPSISEIIPPEINSIAVLPFQNFSDDPDQAFFADGLAQDLITLFTKAPDLRVTPRTASFFYKGKLDQVPISDIASQLKVGSIVEGNVRVSGNRVIVNATLFDVASNQVLWSERFENDLGDIFELQDTIAQTVVDQLELQFAPAAEQTIERVGASSVPLEHLSAYEFFAQGREYLRRPPSDSNLDAAERLFNRALEENSHYAEAHALLCETHLTRYRMSHASETKDFEAAERHCQRATTLDEGLIEVYVAKGELYRNAGKYPDAIGNLKHAIKLSPRYVDAYITLANTYMDNGDIANAEETFETALKIDPTYWAAYADYGTFLFANERYDEAREYFVTWTDLTPDSRSAFNNLAGTHYMLEDFKSSGQAWERSLALGESRSTYTNLGLSYYYTGEFEKAVEMQQQAINIAPNDHRLWGRLAESARFVPGMADVSDAAYDKAIEFGQERLTINQRDWYTLGLLALYQAHRNQTTQADRNMQKALTVAPDEPDLHYLKALMHHELGDRAATYEALETAFKLGFSTRLIASDPDLGPLQSEEAFKALLGELNTDANNP